MTSIANAYGWAPITKSEKQADGSLIVTGRVSDDGLDRDAQRCDATWLDAAVPQWFAEGGNVREMHSHIASGVALEHWKADDGGHMITARIVDVGSIAKLEAGVLRGFSIGIKNGRITKSLDAPNGLIVGGNIIEVSVVDRPSRPTCTLTLAKADEATGDLVEVEQTLVEPAMRVAPIVKDDVVDTLAAGPEDQQPETDVTSDVVIAQSADTVRAAAQGVLDALATLSLPPWVKDDETRDITEAKQAISIIARLIQSEATGLAAGDLDERYDISLLLDAVSALRWFISSEQDEQVEDAVVGVLGLADDPDTTKAEVPVVDGLPAPGAPQTEVVPEGTYLTKADLDSFAESLAAKTESIVAEALTKADEVHKAEVSSLRAELAKVKEQPTAGGPVRIRTTDERVKADNADRTHMLTQADEYDVKADLATERALAEGYRANARELREKAGR